MTTSSDVNNQRFASFLENPQGLSESVAKLRQLATRSSNNLPVEWGYIYPSGKEITSIQTDAYRQRVRNVELSRAQTIALKVSAAWEKGAIASKMRVFPDLRLHAVGDLLRSAANELENGCLRSSFTLLRAALEITAFLTYLEKELSGFHLRLEAAQLETLAADALLNELDEALHLRSFGTKLNWEKIRAEGLLKPEGIESEPAGEILKLKPALLANIFKPLESRVKHARRLYQFVCDFSHPNAPLQVEFVERENHVKHFGLRLTERWYHTSTRSAALMNSFSLAIKDSLEICSECIEAGLVARRNISETADLVEPIARRLVHGIISTEPGVFPAHIACPCQSHLTIGRCCGPDTATVH